MPSQIFQSNIQNVAAVVGENTNNGDGVFGIGHGTTGSGVVGTSDDENAISGIAKKGKGVFGDSKDGIGVHGHSINQHGVWGESENGSGVTGIGHIWQGVFGQSEKQVGVFGQSTDGRGVVGVAKGATGVEGNSTNGAGVWGSSQNGEGVHSETNSPNLAAISAIMLNANGTGAGIYAENRGNGAGIHAKGGRLAGFFEGDVEVTGDIRLTNADFAEDFDVMGKSEPGEVMVLTETGSLEPSCKEYDKKVVGVISGAGDYKPGIILDKQCNNVNRKPIAMMGKVFCKVDADTSAIETGDMLTSSNIPGYAMKACDPIKAFGAVIGKALASLSEGKGLIPILVVLQ